MGKSIILGPVLLVSLSFFCPFFSCKAFGFFFQREGEFMALNSGSFVEALNFWHAHISHHIHLNFRFCLGSLGQFTYVLCAHPTSTLDKFKHFLRAIKAVYFMLNILNPRNNTTNCSLLCFFFSLDIACSNSTYTHTRDVRWWDWEMLFGGKAKKKGKEKLV